MANGVVIQFVTVITKPLNCIWQGVEKNGKKTFINSAFYQCLELLLNYYYYY